jgi:hypothetical protein
MSSRTVHHPAKPKLGATREALMKCHADGKDWQQTTRGMALLT